MTRRSGDHKPEQADRAAPEPGEALRARLARPSPLARADTQARLRARTVATPPLDRAPRPPATATRAVAPEPAVVAAVEHDAAVADAPVADPRIAETRPRPAVQRAPERRRVEHAPPTAPDLPKPVRAPPRPTAPGKSIHVSRRADDRAFQALDDRAREKIEALIAEQENDEAAFDHDRVIRRATPQARSESAAKVVPDTSARAVTEPAQIGKTTKAVAAAAPGTKPGPSRTGGGTSAPKATPSGAVNSGRNAVRQKLELLRLNRDGELWYALMQGKRALIATAAFSFTINLLMLTGPLFMLQVYDRVMASGSMPTLIALSLLTAAMYAAIGAFEFIRSRVVVRLGQEFDSRIADRVFKAALRRSVFGQRTSTAALRELDSIRQFVSGPGPLAIFDAPWTPIYLLIIFAFHWVLGIAATVGAIILLVLAYVSERSSRAPLMEAATKTSEAQDMADVGQRNAEVIAAMGMVDAYRQRWQVVNGEAVAWQGMAADRLGAVTATTKTLRLAFQSMMLAVGAALALNNEISAGTIVAATIIFGRALAPVEQALGQWRGMLRAADSFQKLDDLLKKEPEPQQRTSLPQPRGVVEVSNLRVAAPETRKLILASINFSIEPGKMLAVVGPSASGKSTLSRALVGLWPPSAGTIRLDGAALDQWGPDALGRHIGYLPQSVELFSGTVAENIARFDQNAKDAQIVEAAKRAHAHELILGLPDGYQTQLGDFGAHLSAGQRQRLGLARALYSDPVLVVLDEPNSNLDRAGDNALSAAVDGMRARGQTVVLVSHRVQAIGKADMLLYLDKGLQRAFGPRDEVLAQLQQGIPESPVSAEGDRRQRPR
ncbi:MAG: type I secretion system permease/ATPase [Pseudomonadota bacterium]